MTEKPRILCLYEQGEAEAAIPAAIRDEFDIVEAHDTLEALNTLSHEQFAGVFAGSHLGDALQLGRLIQNQRILEGMPDGVVLLDTNNVVSWANGCFRQWGVVDDVTGRSFYSVLGDPEILGPDFCPFHTAMAAGQPSNTTIRTSDNQFFHVHAAPVSDNGGPPSHLIVTLRDVTAEMLQQQKLEAIHKAGIELGDMTPDEIFDMEIDDRIELLKSNILHYTKDLLNFDVVEIRLLDQNTGQLAPLLSVGINADASNRPLFARPQDNGVTGFVAATGKSYLCEDTLEDPLYIEGFKGAKSSITVPLIQHDQVIGTFNVESPETRAFSESDLQFLEIFSRDLAIALNTLELLVAQKANTAQESVEAIHSAVALPIDEILNDAVNVMEKYIGHEPEVVQRLQSILRNARDIKQVIQTVGQKMTPAEAVPASAKFEKRPKLINQRILVVDVDDSVRNDAHKLLERYGCIVETAHEGSEAISMIRSSMQDASYDAIIADIRLPDLSGYELLVKLRELMENPPLVLMTGFGYDPGHSIVKARQAGLRPNAILYKPFRLDQLLNTVEAILEPLGDLKTTSA